MLFTRAADHVEIKMNDRATGFDQYELVLVIYTKGKAIATKPADTTKEVPDKPAQATSTKDVCHLWCERRG
jgi:hypothetical protein